jgi:hypothetical protein
MLAAPGKAEECPLSEQFRTINKINDLQGIGENTMLRCGGGYGMHANAIFWG